MSTNFSVLPPEVNSARLYAGSGPGPMLAAATAWDGLAVELRSTASAFESITAELAVGAWQGPAALAMSGAAAPYVALLSASAAHAEDAAALARAAVSEFEATLAAVVHPAMVAANRSEIVALATANLFGQNTPAIAAIEGLYEQMWAQDVSAMAAYHAGASAVVAQLAPWQQQLQSLVGAATAATSSGAASAAAAPTVGLVMGGSGFPIPSLGYVQRAFQLYMENIAPFAVPQALFTPQGLYPVVAIRSLTFDVSVAQGLSILDTAIRQQLAAGNNVTVFGFSQSATIASLEMAKLAASVNPPTPDQLSFTLIANPNNPNGGVAARFPGITIPSLGVTASPATPDNLYPTKIYTIEYDGVADFPRYPMNIVSTLNALLGTYYLHNNYFLFSPAQIDAAIPLTNTVGPTMTEYYIIPTHNLPLLEPVRGIPVIGNPLANLVQPNLKVIVNLGYGDPAYGYSTSPPNVPTPFGVFPEVSPITVLDALVAGTHQGINDFNYDIAHLELPFPTDLASVLTGSPAGAGSSAGTGLAIPALSVNDVIDGLQVTNTRVFDTITKVAGTGYSTLLPTADIINALLTTAPSYNIDLFLDGIQQAVNGDPMGFVNALGRPVAADVAIVTAGLALEILILVTAGQTIVGDISALVA